MTDNIEKMKAKHEQDRKDDLEMLKQKICPFRKVPCQWLCDGTLQLNPSQSTLDKYQEDGK
jgi:hypothetical protein